MRIAGTVHFHHESERDYFAVLGKYIDAWGRFENGLYMLLNMIGGNYRTGLQLRGVTPLPAAFKPGPIAFSTKIKLLRTALEAHPDLLVPQDRVLDLLLWAEKEAEARHHLIHGIDQLFVVRENWSSYMYKVENRDPYSSNTSDGIAFDTEDLARRYDVIGDACLNIGILITELSTEIAELFAGPVSSREGV